MITSYITNGRTATPSPFHVDWELSVDSRGAVRSATAGPARRAGREREPAGAEWRPATPAALPALLVEASGHLVRLAVDGVEVAFILDNGASRWCWRRSSPGAPAARPSAHWP